jgi:hypothetical protein
VWDPLDVLCTGLGAGAGAGGVVGGASVGGGAGALLGFAAGTAAGGCAAGAAPPVVALAVAPVVAPVVMPALAAGPVLLVGLGAAFVVEKGEWAGCTGAWLLAEWVGAVRANRIPKAAAARALSWALRLVRRERRRRPLSRSVAAGLGSYWSRIRCHQSR